MAVNEAPISLDVREMHINEERISNGNEVNVAVSKKYVQNELGCFDGRRVILEYPKEETETDDRAMSDIISTMDELVIKSIRKFDKEQQDKEASQ